MSPPRHPAKNFLRDHLIEILLGIIVALVTFIGQAQILTVKKDFQSQFSGIKKDFEELRCKVAVSHAKDNLENKEKKAILRRQAQEHFQRAKDIARSELGSQIKESTIQYIECRRLSSIHSDKANQDAIACLNDVKDKGYNDYNLFYNLAAL